MVLRDIKYLFSYVLPLTTLYSLQAEGIASFSTLILAFVLIPLLELFVPQWTQNFNEDDKSHRSNVAYFDILLFINLFWVGFVIFVFYKEMNSHGWTTFEWIGKILCTGITLGSNGINVAHELGHKKGLLHQAAAQLLLLPSMYVHFTTEHNYGHHDKVGTPEDPATAKKGEWLFIFWIRSIVLSYISAWKIKLKLNRQYSGVYRIIFHPFVVFVIWPLLYPVVLYQIGGYSFMISLVFAGFVSILLLETINYVEHYGLFRKMLPSGRYEPVNMVHSWNSNHEVGRVVLYELTRHSDHHYKAHKKYQNLDHFDESPQLPYGYPGSMMLALIPPLWFSVMDPLLLKWKDKTKQTHEAYR